MMTSGKAVAILTGLLFILSLSTTAFAADELYGTWSLVSFKLTRVDTGETTDMFGTAPKGLMTFGRDGRMLAVLTGNKRPNVPDATKLTDKDRAELYKTLIAWGGPYTFDGKTLKFRVDVSWNESWNGTEQVRQVKFEGKRMTISTGAAAGALDGKPRISVFVWERVP